MHHPAPHWLYATIFTHTKIQQFFQMCPGNHTDLLKHWSSGDYSLLHCAPLRKIKLFSKP